MKLLHYTLNTADVFDCSQKTYSADALKLLRPIAQRAILEGQTESPLPAPLDRYRLKVTIAEGCAVFDLYDRGTILNSNAVAWTESGQKECWSLFEALYLKLMGEFETVTISRSPQMPDRLPWLATLVLPSPGALVGWLADFEQCLAIALIDAAAPKPKRNKPKGFGK